MMYVSGKDGSAEGLHVIENWSALHERLSRPGGGVTKLVTLMERQVVSPFLGVYILHVNWMVGYHILMINGVGYDVEDKWKSRLTRWTSE